MVLHFFVFDEKNYDFANKKINIKVISTSEIKISVLIDKKNTKKALNALHKEFKLDNRK